MSDGTRSATDGRTRRPASIVRLLATMSVASTLRSRSRRPRSPRRWLIGMSILAILSLALTVGLCLVVVDILGRTKDGVATEYAKAVRTECPELAAMVTRLQNGAPLTVAGAGEISRRVRGIRQTPAGRVRCRIEPGNPLLPEVDGIPTIAG